METAPSAALESGITELVHQRRIVSGIGISYGSADRSVTFCRGNAQETLLQNGAFSPAPVALTNDSIYDLASVTKIFTCIAIMQLVEQQKLSLDACMDTLDRRFLHIGDVSVRALLSFSAALATDERIDAQLDPVRAERLLFSIRKTIPHERRFYTDMGAMLLKYVVEAVSDQSFFAYLSENILRPLGMKDTFAEIPQSALSRTVNYNYERRMPGGVFSVDTNCPSGVVHDPKARILSRNGASLCGHAGLFSTVPDMALLARGLLQNEILSRETLLQIGVDRTGKRFADGSYSQHMGYLCYAKHPVQTFSEVPACFGERTIALNGFTGNHFSVDPVQGKYMILFANRIHNRITVRTGRAQPDDDVQTALWNDGKEYPVSQNFVYMKDRCLKGPIGEILKGF